MHHHQSTKKELSLLCLDLVSFVCRCGCGVVAVVVCACGVVWHAEKHHVCTFKTSQCAPAPSPHVQKMWASCWCTRRRFERAHGDAFGAYTPFSSLSNTHHQQTTDKQVHWNSRDETLAKSQETTDNRQHKERQRHTHNSTEQRNTTHATRVTQDETRQDRSRKGQGQHEKNELFSGNKQSQADHEKFRKQ